MSSAPPPTPKWLVGAVVMMGVLIVIGVVALLWVIIHRIQHHKELVSLTPSIASNAVMPPQGKVKVTPAYHDVLAPPATLTLVPRPGEQIQSLTAREDGSLAVKLRTHEGAERVLIWIPEQARISAELELKSEVKALESAGSEAASPESHKARSKAGIAP